jgi:hypothetical protein
MFMVRGRMLCLGEEEMKRLWMLYECSLLTCGDRAQDTRVYDYMKNLICNDSFV